MINEETAKHLSGEIRYDEDKRSVCFQTYERATAFVKDLLAESEEITKATVSVQWVQYSDSPKAKVEHYLFEVKFLYNCYIENDKRHFRKVLNKHRKYIVMAGL